MSDEEKSAVAMKLAEAFGATVESAERAIDIAIGGVASSVAAIEALRAEPVTYLVRHEGANRHARRKAMREVEG